MSLLTRCPACTTIYKVVPDQLRISQGWVKCGQCGDIFDATQHLVHIKSERLPQEAVQEKLADEAPLAVQEQVMADPMPAAAESELPQQTSDTALGTKQVPEKEYKPESESESESESEQASISSTQDLMQVQETSDTAEQSQQEITADAHDLSFMRSDHRSQFWHKPWVRAGSFVLVILLTLSLIGQWVYRDRHYLAAVKPEFKPALYAFCNVLGCQVAALQQIESLAIDSAVFNKVDDTHYRLSFLLKNAATVAVAAPSIELTLTDLQEFVVLRRVFSARELDNMIDSVSPASQWQVSVALRLETSDAMQRVVGYKVLAFYP